MESVNLMALTRFEPTFGTGLGPDVVIAWPAVFEAATNTLHRGTVKGVWPTPAFREGIVGTTDSLPDVAPPPALYLYRVAGVNCAGVEGP